MTRLLPLLAALLLVGCITIDTASKRKPLVETVVHGDDGPKVLLLEVDGIITEGEISGPLGLGRREGSVARIREQLDKAEEEGDIEALLVRINSPGGTVTASDLLYREISEWKKQHEVPVIAHMMGVAASGGYYTAMAADLVMAHPTTVTGSIGVISAGLNLAGLLNRFGIEDQTFKAGEFKDAGTPLRPMTSAERAYLQALLDDFHGRFRDVVAAGRPSLDRARVDDLSDGRVYTAEQALASGLVDVIGYLPDAIDELEGRLAVSSLRVVSYHREREWRTNLYSTQTRVEEPGRSGLDSMLELGLRGPTFLYLWWPGHGYH